MATRAIPHTEEDLKVPEIAKMLDVTTAYIYKLLKDRKLVGRRNTEGEWLVGKGQVEELLAKKRGKQASSPPRRAQRPAVPVAAAADGGDSEGELHRRRADDVFPSFRLIMGDPGDFVRRLDDLFAEMRSIRRAMEALVAAITPVMATISKDELHSGPFVRT